MSYQTKFENLLAAVKEHHSQKADDRCIEDDDRLYAAAGLPPCDRRVGDKADMLVNCARFIEKRCQGGGWPSYAELEKEIARLRKIEIAARAALEGADLGDSSQAGDLGGALKQPSVLPQEYPCPKS